MYILIILHCATAPDKFESAYKLALFFNSHIKFGTNLAKLIVSIGVVGIRYTSYIITITLIEPSILEPASTY